MRPKLTLVAGKADKAEIRLKLPTIVGRTREAGLMIAHKTVSRRHCELFERHGMLFVRDTGSRNGTLVDDALIKESMVKPGHTLTVGPLTFRADYEPADAFIQADNEPGADSTADNSKTVNNDAIIGTTPLTTGTQVVAQIVPAADDTVDTPIPEVAELPAFDDDLELKFDLDEVSSPVAAAASEEEVVEFAVNDASLDDGPDALPELGAGDDLLSFDLDDELPTPDAAAAPAASAKESVDELSFDEEDLNFSLDDEPATPPAAQVEEEVDELGFTLEDLQDSSPAPEAEVAPAEEDEEVLSFELAEPEATPEKKPSAADNAKVRLGEEKKSGDEAAMSDFMKELGL